MALMVKSRRRAASSTVIDGIAGHVEAAVTAPGLRLAARQRDVDVAELVDLEALADGLDAAERFEQRAEAIGGEAEDLDVDVLGRRGRAAGRGPSRRRSARGRPPSRTAPAIARARSSSVSRVTGRLRPPASDDSIAGLERRVEHDRLRAVDHGQPQLRAASDGHGRSRRSSPRQWR